MRSNYKKLGSLIREVVEKNTDLSVTNLLGVSITKQFIPSIANTVGTDMTTYKVVRKTQFAYGPVTSRNGDKISVALLMGDASIVSTSYTVFEIIDHEQLDPEYLMMWFRRPEFDRYARFKSHGSVREIFDWEEMGDVELPIPSIDKQREIVREYNTIVERIKLNEQLTQKLEETAKALYKRWFVDFEFPISKEYAESIGKPELEGTPYKSNNGEFALNSKYETEIPLGWEIGCYEIYMDFRTGKLNSNASVVNGKYPFFTCSSETFKTNSYSFDCEAVLLAGNNASAIYPLKYFSGKFDAYQRTYVVTPRDKRVSVKQIYFSIMTELEGFKGTSSGTATKFLTMGLLNSLIIVVAYKIDADRFSKIIGPLFQYKLNAEHELEKLNEMEQLILKRIATKFS